jgi:multiple sugar transport system permease protein
VRAPELPGLRASGRLTQAAILAGLVLVTLFFLVPVLWALVTALKQHRDIFVSPPLFVFRPTLDNFRFVLSNSPYLHYFVNSLIASGLSSVASLFIAAMAAYAFSRFKVRASGNILMWILSLRMTPPMAIVVPFYLMAVATHLYDTRIGLALVLITVDLPIAVWMLVGYLEAIPADLDSAAMIDGCSRLGALVRVVLPPAAPGLVATLILCFIFSWNEFPLSVVLTSQSAVTLPVSMMGWDTERGLQWGHMMAAGIMATAPVVALAILIQRYLVRGLTMGAVVE